MTEAEKERVEIVAWLREAPFPWANRKASLWIRIKSAWIILCQGEVPLRGMLAMAALKIERGDHKGADHE